MAPRTFRRRGRRLTGDLPRIGRSRASLKAMWARASRPRLHDQTISRVSWVRASQLSSPAKPRHAQLQHCPFPCPRESWLSRRRNPPGSPAVPPRGLRIAAACGPILGAARIRVESRLTTAYPAACTRLTASARKSAESAPFQRGSDGENREPMSGAATAPSKASVMACNSTSPSECPPNPFGCGRVSPPIFNGMPRLNS